MIDGSSVSLYRTGVVRICFVFYLILSIVHKRGEKKQEELLLEHARQTQQLYYQEQKKYEELQRQRHECR